MKDFLSHLADAATPPSYDFKTKLREKLLQYDARFVEEKISSLTADLSPSRSFSIRLRQNLLLPFRSRKPLVRRFRFSFSSAVPFLRAGASLVTVIAVVFVSFVFGIQYPTQASSESVIDSYFGDVHIFRGAGDETPASSGISLFPGTSVLTGYDSATTIHFFEDSILRLDEKTEVRILRLEPNSIRNDLGVVEVELVSGRIWVKSFAVDEDYSQFLLHLPEVVSPVAGGALDAEKNMLRTVVRSRGQSIRVFTDTVETILPEGSAITFYTGGNTTVDRFPENESFSSWATGNLKEDRFVGKGFVTKKMIDRKKNVDNSLDELRGHFLLPGNIRQEEEIYHLELLLFEGMSNIALGKEPQESIDPFISSIREFHETHPEEAKILLASARKMLQPITPDSLLFSAKKALDDLVVFLEPEPIIAQESKRTKRLWEAKVLAESGNLALAEALVNEATLGDEMNTGSISPEITLEIIDERQEQMAAVSALQNTDVAKEILANAEETLLNHSAELVRPRFPTKKELPDIDIAQNIISRIKIYSSEQGQKNTLRSHLKNISATPENMGVLRELRQRLPEHLKNEVDVKIVSVLGVEKVRVAADIISDTSFVETEPKEQPLEEAPIETSQDEMLLPQEEDAPMETENTSQEAPLL